MVLAALAAALCGCMTMGSPFKVEQVPQIQIGKTTGKDLRGMFGDPYRSGIDDGDSTETWLNYHLSLFGDQKTRDLYVRYKADGTVKSYSLNSNFPEDQVSLTKKN
jgi:hypothetical protein